MELGLFRGAFALYTLSTLLALAYLFSRQERLTAWMWRLMGIALALHALSFGLRLASFWSEPANRYLVPIHTLYGALTLLAFVNALVFWIVEGLARLHILGAFVLPWTALAAAAALGADPAAGLLPESLRSRWMNLHPVVLMVAYTGFANAFGVGLALLIQEKQIKSRKPGELCYRLPAIEELDGLQLRLLAVFLPVFTIGALMGGMWAHRAWGRFWGWDAKETATALTWLLYASALALRLLAGMRGRRIAYLSMIAFSTLLLTFFGIDALSRLHGYLSD